MLMAYKLSEAFKASMESFCGDGLQLSEAFKASMESFCANGLQA